MTRFYLIFSAAGLFVFALGYGIAPATILPKLLNISIEGIDLTHILRAVMGLYFGMIVLWSLGAFHQGFTRTALIAEIAFMYGLAFGRIISILVDGVPSALLLLYTVLEITMGTWGIILMKREDSTTKRA